MRTDSGNAGAGLISMKLPPAEELPPGADGQWKSWRCLKCLRTGVGRSKAAMQVWGFSTEPTTCPCGHPCQTMEHLLECPSLGTNKVTAQDLAENTILARACVMRWAQAI